MNFLLQITLYTLLSLSCCTGDLNISEIEKHFQGKDENKTKVSLNLKNIMFPSLIIPEEEKRKKKDDQFHDLPEDLDQGEPIFMKERQLAKSNVQQEPNGSDPNLGGDIFGFKPPGQYVPWQIVGGSSVPQPSEEMTTTSDDTIDPSDPPPPIDFLLPRKKIPAENIFGLCGEEKGATCFGYPEDCLQSRKCYIAVAISSSSRVKRATEGAPPSGGPQWMKISMATTSPKGFVAVAFSDDRFMGDDIVAHCNQLPKSDWMTLHLSQNIDYTSVIQRDRINWRRNFHPIAGSVQENGVIACEFEMRTTIFMDKDSGPSATGINMMEKSYHILQAFGRHSEKNDSNDPEFGALRFHHMAVVSSEKLDMTVLLSEAKTLQPRSAALLMLHIIPSIMAFSFLLPCAIFIANFGKEAHSNIIKKFITAPAWLFIHTIFLICAVVLSLISLIGIVLELGWVWRSIGGKATIHSILGFFAILFLWLNAILGGFNFKIRSKEEKNPSKEINPSEEKIPPENKKKIANQRFKHFHLYLGYFTLGFGMLALCLAHEMRRAFFVPCIFLLIVLLQIFVILLTEVGMMFHTNWLTGKIEGKGSKIFSLWAPVRSWTEKDIAAGKKRKNDKIFHEMPLWCGRRRAIIFYFITSGFCCIGMMAVIFLPMVLCRQDRIT